MNSERIMVVEDEWFVTDQICRNLIELGYTVCSTTSNGEDAVSYAEADKPDLVLMDIVLKGEMDGIEAADRITSQFNIPVIYLTAYTSEEYIERAKMTKPFGYLVKPFNQQELYASIEMAIQKHRVDEEIKDYLDRLVKCFKGTIHAFSETIELRGPYPLGHHRRVAELARAIAREMGLSDFSVEGLGVVSYVYDISFMNLPIGILQDAGRLTGLNLTLYCTYPQRSYDILKKVDFPWPVADIVLQHRECFDGSGIPHGIKGDDILLEARILAVADTLEDLTCHRTFRNALTIDAALKKISEHKGASFDPEVVDACLRLFYEKNYKMEN